MCNLTLFMPVRSVSSYSLPQQAYFLKWKKEFDNEFHASNSHFPHGQCRPKNLNTTADEMSMEYSPAVTQQLSAAAAFSSNFCFVQSPDLHLNNRKSRIFKCNNNEWIKCRILLFCFFLTDIQAQIFINIYIYITNQNLRFIFFSSLIAAVDD